MPGLGTLINGLAVIGGGLLGLIFRKGLPQSFQIKMCIRDRAYTS